ncbi:glutathione S-transferase family protein [Pelagimonas varians]|uniref:Disulfide-bond oxidoreductase YfcG n=1 Tax=Pelagimonas varians TaxID=696760 RepID=A0A238JSS3_9RHOB|nr:glutathione S-transferase family protein [Pelagimonas varians]PYG34618.1 glutathione S-transferase [Pelagimonas varians]SMX33234.1 Disulfide-bond oxidoreductase YfcG [Pelagimonas varians]
MTQEIIRVHNVPYSRGFRVLWLLEELGLSYDVVNYKIGDRSMREGGLDALSPATRVPAIEIGDLVMAESGAIVQHLIETHGPQFGRPVGDPERPAFLQWLHYSETMASLVEQLNLNHVFLRPPAKPSAIVIKLNTARLRQSLAGMEARLGNHDFLLPGGFSGADIMMGFNLYAVPFYVDCSEFPKLLAYRKRLEARPAYQTALAKEGPQEFYDRDFYPVPEE